MATAAGAGIFASLARALTDDTDESLLDLTVMFDSDDKLAIVDLSAVGLLDAMTEARLSEKLRLDSAQYSAVGQGNAKFSPIFSPKRGAPLENINVLLENSSPRIFPSSSSTAGAPVPHGLPAAFSTNSGPPQSLKFAESLNPASQNHPNFRGVSNDEEGELERRLAQLRADRDAHSRTTQRSNFNDLDI